MGNIGASTIMSIGDICLETNIDSKLVLKDVRHILDICLNLILSASLMMMTIAINLVKVNGSSPWAS